jgi:methyl-accepting chemotaxis protein
MRQLTLRRKFTIGMALVLAVSLLVLAGGRLLAKGARFHYLERQHLAAVMQIRLAVERAGNPATPVPKQAVLSAIDEAREIAGHVEYELFEVEYRIFRVMGFGELVDLPYQGLEHLAQLRRTVTEAPGETLTGDLVQRMQPALTQVQASADRFAPLTAEAVGVTQMIVFGINGLGGLVLLAVFWIIRGSVLPPLERALQLARGIALGDLTGTVRVDSDDEVGRLMAALRDMQGSLAGMVEQLRLNSEQLHDTSAEIARGNGDLGARTENQASALEETAASMEELASAIRENAANAQVASELSLAASSIAQQGGEAVARLVRTMRGMTEAARSIGEITGLIDGIAFQTNILALNAAVEAARAGEQGRGFAVVAGEVRVLAARSAEAARDIRALIEATAARVDEGTTLADRAGETMHEVVDSITRVSGLVGEISEATTEQSAGVNQVGSALTQIDGVTQQNAALVEELSAAADGLRRQAEELVASVGVFKLSSASPQELMLLPASA